MIHVKRSETGQRRVFDDVRRKWRVIPAGGSTDEGGDGTEGEGDEEGGSGDGTDESEKGSASSGGTDTVSREEYESLKERMRAADRAKSAAEAKVRDYEDQDKSDLDKAQRDLSEVTEERDTLAAENAALKTKLAVVTSEQAARFHDVSDALVQIGLDDLIDDDGNVDSKKVESELKSLAERKPHLVKPEQEEQGSDGDEEEEEGDGKGDDAPANTGRSTRRRKGGDDTYDRKTLEKKYPALRR